MRSSELLSPGLLAQLERLQLATRRRLAGRFSGEHRSPAFGTSVDFSDYREYHPGDDFRRIDYPLFARTGNLFIRLFEAEDDVTVRIVIDRSASMGMHGKLDQAVRMAAAIGFIALLRRDTVILHTIPDAAAEAAGAAGVPNRGLKPERRDPAAWPSALPARRFTGRHATRPLFDVLAELEAAGLETSTKRADLVGASRDVLARRSRAGVTVVISDLLDEGWSVAIDRLVAGGGDTSVLHVLAEDELRPDLRGDLAMIDVETGQEVPASLSPAGLREYAEHVAAWLAETSGHCRRRGATYVRVMADDAPENVLLRSWREQGLVR